MYFEGSANRLNVGCEKKDLMCRFLDLGCGKDGGGPLSGDGERQVAEVLVSTWVELPATPLLRGSARPPLALPSPPRLSALRQMSGSQHPSGKLSLTLPDGGHCSLR